MSPELQTFATERYTVAGFGVTETGKPSDVLMKLTLPKVSIESCQSKYTSVNFSPGFECYGGEGDADSCHGKLLISKNSELNIAAQWFHFKNSLAGDSGSPLINYATNAGKTKAVQVGIVVAGNASCGKGAKGFPGIYADVPHYLEWILKNIEE